MIFLKLYNKLVSEAKTELRFPIFARVPFLQRPSAQPQREREIKKKKLYLDSGTPLCSISNITGKK